MCVWKVGAEWPPAHSNRKQPSAKWFYPAVNTGGREGEGAAPIRVGIYHRLNCVNAAIHPGSEGGGGIAVYAPSRNGRIFGVQMVQGGREREGRRSANRQTAKSLNRVSIALLDLDSRDTEGEGVGSMVRREFGKFAGKSVIFLSRDLSLTD